MGPKLLRISVIVNHWLSAPRELWIAYCRITRLLNSHNKICWNWMGERWLPRLFKALSFMKVTKHASGMFYIWDIMHISIKSSSLGSMYVRMYYACVYACVRLHFCVCVCVCVCAHMCVSLYVHAFYLGYVNTNQQRMC